MSWQAQLKKHLPDAQILHDMPEIGLALILADIDKLWEQDENARTMSRQMFNQLTQNVSSRRGLESVPFCALTEKAVEIVSGHHRIRSLRTARNKDPSINKTLPILLDVTGLTRSEIAAKQLAHNSLEGFDDPQMLKKIYLTIESAELRLEAFIDEKKLDLTLPDKVVITPLSAGFEFEHVKMFFLPHQLENFEKVLETIDGDEAKIFLTNKEHWPIFKEAVNKTMTEEDIRSLGSAVARMCEIILKHFEENKNVATTPNPPP